MYESIEFPRIHNIERLRRLVPDRWEVSSSDVQLAVLTPWAVAGRYPADTPEATAIDAHDALEIAGAVVGSVEADFERFSAADAGQPAGQDSMKFGDQTDADATSRDRWADD